MHCFLACSHRPHFGCAPSPVAICSVDAPCINDSDLTPVVTRATTIAGWVRHQACSFYHAGSYHGISIAVQKGHLAANGCFRSKLPVSEVERQVLQLCGSPTEVWRIPAELDPGFRIGLNFAERGYSCPIRRRALVRIDVKLPPSSWSKAP